MKLNYKLVLTVVSLGALLTASCQKETLDQNPQASLEASTAIKDAATVNAATLGIYSGFQSGNYWGLRYFAFSDMYADNINHVGTFPSFSAIWNVAILPDNTEVSAMWNSMYSTINRANTVIAAVPGIADPTLNKDNALAEARVLRANVYFDLIRYWGGSITGFNKAGGVGVPLVLTPTLVEADAKPKARATEAAVMAQVIADLDFAIGVATFPNNNTTGRVNKDYAKALRARVALYMDDNTTALTYSNELIASGRYALTPGVTYRDIWANKNTKESLWEIQFEPTNSNSVAFFYYTTATGGRNEIATSSGLNTAHEAGDVRQAINATTLGGGSTNLKTLKFTRVSTGDDNVVMFRLSELYLIRAEARAQIGTDLVGALADVNVIRIRAGLAANTTATTTATLMTAILKERRVEFAHEGHRFFDLKRTNLLATTIGASYFGISGTINNTFRALWPIPQREVLTSGGIIAQNTGY
jgi:hypothetical protein